MSEGGALAGIGVSLVLLAVFLTRVSGGAFAEGLMFLLGLFLLFLGGVLLLRGSERAGEL